MHKEYKRTALLWELETRVIKIVERKEVAAALEDEERRTNTNIKHNWYDNRLGTLRDQWGGGGVEPTAVSTIYRQNMLQHNLYLYLY